MAVEHEQVGVIATVILAVIVGAIGTIIYLIFLKPCTDIKEEDSDKKGSKNLTKKHDEGIPKKRPNSTSSSSSSSSKRKVAKDSNSVTTHGLLLTSLKGHTGTVTSIDFSSNGKYLASCSEGSAVYARHICFIYCIIFTVSNSFIVHCNNWVIPLRIWNYRSSNLMSLLISGGVFAEVLDLLVYK